MKTLLKTDPGRAKVQIQCWVVAAGFLAIGLEVTGAWLISLLA